MEAFHVKSLAKICVRVVLLVWRYHQSRKLAHNVLKLWFLYNVLKCKTIGSIQRFWFFLNKRSVNYICLATSSLPLNKNFLTLRKKNRKLKEKSQIFIWFWKHHMFMPLEDCALISGRKCRAAGDSRLWHRPARAVFIDSIQTCCLHVGTESREGVNFKWNTQKY